MRQPHIYADASVYGGCFDDEFHQASRRFFAEIVTGKFILVISTTLLNELQEAPENIQQIIADLPQEYLLFVDYDDETAQLRDAYLDAGIVGLASKSDAEHIAAATVAGADFVVSWNFKHIVHYDKINGYQAVNLMNGYKEIRIYSPREVIDYEE